jgi:hypothetical protein
MLPLVLDDRDLNDVERFVDWWGIFLLSGENFELRKWMKNYGFMKLKIYSKKRCITCVFQFSGRGLYCKANRPLANQI